MSWLTGWSKRIPITVNASDIQGDLSGFPLMIKLSANAGKNSSNIVQALPTLFEMRDVPGWSFKENKYYESYNPNTTFNQTDPDKYVEILSDSSNLGGLYMWCTVRKELLIPGCQIEYNWRFSTNSASARTRVFMRDGKQVRDDAHYPYEDSKVSIGNGTLQTLEDVYDSIAPHTTKVTLDHSNSICDHVTFEFYAIDGSNSHTYDIRLMWMRWLDKDDNVLFNLDLSGEFVQETSGTYQDYAKVGDPDSENHNIGKIALTTSDGETQVPVEIESWNFENEEIILWAPASLSSSTDTTLYLYYDENQTENTDYVGAPIVQSTADLVDEDCSSLSGWTDADGGNGDSRMTVDGKFFEFFNGFNYSTSNRTIRYKTFSSGHADREVIEIKLLHRRIGTYANNDGFRTYFRNENGALFINICLDGLYVWKDDAAWHEIYDFSLNQGNWYTWVFDWTCTTTSSGILDVYLDGHKVAENEDVYGDLGETYPAGNIYLRGQGYTIVEARTVIDYIKIGTDIIKRNVWDDDYIGVWHMDKHPTAIQDSTHNIDLTAENMGYANTVTGTLGRALSFNGSDERLYSGDDDWLDTTDLTVSTFFKPDSDTAGTMVGRYDSSANNKRIWALRKKPTYQVSVDIGNSDGTSGAEQAITSANTISGGRWDQAAFTFSGGTGVESVYINGQSVGFTGTQTNTSLNTSDNDKTLEIGARNDGGSDFYDGDIDEVRISSTVRPDAWINAEYESCVDNLVTYGQTNFPPQTSVDTRSAWYQNPYYNTSSEGFEVYNTDISTEYYIAKATISGGVNAICLLDGTVYIGTTNSGIFSMPETAVSGTDIYVVQDLNPHLSVFKQYPDITGNNITALAGAGDYLTAITISGIDHFNLGHSDAYYRTFATISGMTKCAQSEKGKFYYLGGGTEAYTIYTHQCEWDENSIGYTYTTTSGNLFPAGCNINNISIVDHDTGVTDLYFATTSGVVLVEENPGDEENTRYKRYLLEV